MTQHTEDQIAHETPTHWVLEAKPGYFEVYRYGLTHSTLCASIGPYVEPGRARLRAIEECDRRTVEEQQPKVDIHRERCKP